MDERLQQAVDETGIVDAKLFLQLMSMIGDSDSHSIDWSKLRHLYLLPQSIYSDSHPEYVGKGIYIDSTGTRICAVGESIPMHLIHERCAEMLETLCISNRSYFSIDFLCFPNLKHLHLSRYYGRVGSLDHLRHLPHLESLTLENITNYRLLDLKGLTELSSLRLKNCSIRRIFGLEQLTRMKRLIITGMDLEHDIDVSGMHELEILDVSRVSAAAAPYVKGFERLEHLESLNLVTVAVPNRIDLSRMKALRHLALVWVRGFGGIKGFSAVPELRTVSLRDSGLRQIPEELRGLKNLERLDLSGLYLKSLPKWLPELGMDIHRSFKLPGICLDETKVPNVDMSIFDQPQDVIRQWFRDNPKVPLQEVKVVFLGDGEAGKTHIITRILHGGAKPEKQDFDGESTPGILITDKIINLDGKDVKVHFWDFGGQEILHSMHRMFLTERTLYVVVINVRDDRQDEQARYWLHNIRSFAAGSPVMLVLNKLDQNPNATVNESRLREIYHDLRQIVRISALKYDREEFNDALTSKLLEQIRELGTVGTMWPASWAELKAGLEGMSTNFIKWDDYRAMCDRSGVKKNREELLRWFHDLGVSFCYQGSERLEDYVILRPDWITNAIYTILFNQSSETRNGVIPKSVIHRMLHPRGDETDRFRRVRKDISYSLEHAEFVLEVMRKFRLSYSVSDKEEFIPALCNRDSMGIDRVYAADPKALEFRLTYEYLPENVIHRLMVEMRSDLQLSDVWRTGALFRQAGTGLSAVVSSMDNVLSFYVRSDEPMHRPNTYLSHLKENVERINRELKLDQEDAEGISLEPKPGLNKKPYAEVVYKTEWGKECFDYQDLLYALKEGETEYRSKLLRRYIPIWDILNQTSRADELELEKLRDDIVTACMQMQGNRTYWTAQENERNTYLRDTLRNMKYIANDQTLHGEGEGRKSYGELDLEIRQEKEIPWTVLEALRIRDNSTTSWNKHLQKLLDKYNPEGLKHLFLLTYVECSKDAFPGIMEHFKEHVRQHNAGYYTVMPRSFALVSLPRHGDPAYLRVLRCTYDRNGAPITVTHIFARIGE